MILKNPTDQELRITYRGDEYVLPAKGSVGAEVPDDVKAYWKNNIHQFLELVDAGKEVKKIEEPAPRIVTETVTEEAKKEAPVKEKKEKATK